MFRSPRSTLPRSSVPFAAKRWDFIKRGADFRTVRPPLIAVNTWIYQVGDLVWSCLAPKGVLSKAARPEGAMFCTHCGKQNPEHANFCFSCRNSNRFQ